MIQSRAKRSDRSGPDGTGGGRVVAICGGVGGAKLALGLHNRIGEDLTVVVNTGDDFEHLGLSISPDIDTVLYTLGNRSDTTRGWGRADESWHFMAALAELGGETWFNLGDRDLALHIERTRRLRAGEALSAVTMDIARRFGIRAVILPMSDEPVRTRVHTPDGDLGFQRYFVEHRCEPVVTGLSFAGAEECRLVPAALRALQEPSLRAIVLCPSNPYLSIDPILAVPGMREAIRYSRAPVVAVSPIIGGDAVKGPTAKIMRELGVPLASRTIAEHYHDLLDGIVIDHMDHGDAASLFVKAHVTGTLMRDLADRDRLAREVLVFADAIRAGSEADRA